MFATLTECGHEKIGGTVRNQMLLDKISGRSDENGDLDQPTNLLEVAKRGLGLCQYVDRAVFCRFLAGCCVDVAAEQAGGLELAVLERQLPGGEQQIAGLALGHVVSGWCRRDGKRHAQIA